MSISKDRDNIDKELASEKEDQFVHKVYNEIASHFSNTRYKPWPIVEKFLKDQPDYSIGVDVGTGNGKYLGVNKNLFMIGLDRSEGLISCAKENSDNQYNIEIADGLSIPHRDSCFDFAISIAVIHHFSTRERRVYAISCILDKLKIGGRLLIYCWALEQESSRRGYKEGDDQDVLVPWVMHKQKKKKSQGQDMKNAINNQGEEQEEQKQQQVQEEEENLTKYRYYHLYKKQELHDDTVSAGRNKIIEEGYERDNWWIIIERV